MTKSQRGSDVASTHSGGEIDTASDSYRNPRWASYWKSASPMNDTSLLRGTDVLVVGPPTWATQIVAALEDAVAPGTVSTAESRAAARDILERNDHESVGCLLVDGVDDALFDAAQSHGKDILAVVDGEPTAALAAGATDVIRRDDPPSVIAARVSTVLERSRPSSRDLAAEESDEDGPTAIETHAVTHANALVAVLDHEGTLQFVTPTVETELGYTPADLERTGIERIVHPDDRETLRDVVDGLREAPLGSTRRHRCRLRHADGTWAVYGLTVTTRLADPAVEGLVCTLTRAEPLTTDDRAAIDTLGYGILGVGPNWELTCLNESARQLFELPTDARLGTVLWELLPEPLLEPIEDWLREARATGSTRVGTLTPPTRAHPIEVHVHPSESGVSVYIRPVTTESGQQAATDRPESYKSILEALPDPVLVLEDSHVTVANTAAHELFERTQLVGHSIGDLVADDGATAIERRAAESLVRRTDPIETTIEGRDEPTAVEVLVTPLSASMAICTLSRQSQTTPPTLADARIDLLRGESREAVAQRLVEAVVDRFPGAIVGSYLVDGTTARPVATSQAVTGGSIELPPISLAASDRRSAAHTPLVTALADGQSSAFERPEHDAALAALCTQLEIEARAALVVPLGEQGVLVVAQPVADAIDPDDRGAIDTLGADAAHRLADLKQVATAADHRRERQRLTERIERLTAFLERVRAATHHSVEAATRAEIEAAVCAELGRIPWVEFVWIGAGDSSRDRVEPRAVGGSAQGYLEAVAADLGIESQEPTSRALTTESTVSVDVARLSQGPWRRQALERNVGAVLSVPIVYDDYVFGALSLYVDDHSRIDDAVSTALDGLAETVAFAINAIETRRALLAESVVELEIGVGSTADTLLSIARQLDGHLDVRMVLPQEDDRTTVIFTAKRGPVAIEDIDGVCSLREIGGDDERIRYEAVLEGAGVIRTVTIHGGLVRSVRGDERRLTVELPHGRDVRSFLGRLQQDVPETELLARRERERSAESRQVFQSAVTDQLTDRQLQILQTAYESGFFEWPRESTGEAVASSLGISQPTFARHFRAAERKLYALLFDETVSEFDAATDS